MIKNKLAIGFLTLAITALVGTTGTAGAMGSGGHTTTPNPPATKEDCKNGGWKNHTDENGKKFKNQGKCISWVNDHGYGGTPQQPSNPVVVTINTIVAGMNNTVNNVINVILGSIPNGGIAFNVNTGIQGSGNVVNNIVKFVFG